MNSIILIDKDNLHGRLMRYIINPPLDEADFNFTWERLDENNLNSILSKYKSSKGDIFCIPLSWTTTNYNEQISILAKNNIILAPFDEQELYPWSLPGVIPILQSKTITLNIGDTNITTSGNSVTCALAACEWQKKYRDS